MGTAKRLYHNENWFKFSHKIKSRDGFKCVQCGRNQHEVILQVHHQRYIPNKPPWVYPFSDCLTLCKGCHARKHKLIPPHRGWTLICIEDLGGLNGICERQNCGQEIRYEHLTYHPDWGYLIVGSTCIEHLTREDIELSSEVLNLYNRVGGFLQKYPWKNGYSSKGNSYIQTTFNRSHIIRIYGSNNNYAFQILFKEKGIRYYDFGKIVFLKNKSLIQVKELAFITLIGTLETNIRQKNILRNLYKSIK